MQGMMLGDSGVSVSDICLGTMTFGNQTSAENAHRQMDRALDAGITFLDTAEMYPVNPVRRETIGRTEEIVGDWIAARGVRDRVHQRPGRHGPPRRL
jgi:aryl-alcohol dehydrogenase-like predicted oxidoreductase